MPTLQEAIKKAKRKESDQFPEIRGFIEIIFEELKKDVEKLKDAALEEIEERFEETFKGEKGDKGDPGKDGITPVKGVNYFTQGDVKEIAQAAAQYVQPAKDGRDGKDGKPGKDGHRGLDGKNGHDGKDGRDGTEITPQEVAQKLNTLKSTIKISVIEGLEERLSSVLRVAKEKSTQKNGGGGLGNIQHESKNVSSASTSISTNYPIAGGGFAIIGAYYQGEFITRGTHYTVGANRKTLTLTFVPIDNTTIDLVYIRG